MSEYINRNELLKTVNESPAEAHNERCAQLIEAILYAPTADVVEVVRCKDCKYYKDGECVLHSEPKERRLYERWTVDVRENDYCSYGKKRRRKK